MAGRGGCVELAALATAVVVVEGGGVVEKDWRRVGRERRRVVVGAVARIRHVERSRNKQRSFHSGQGYGQASVCRSRIDGPIRSGSGWIIQHVFFPTRTRSSYCATDAKVNCEGEGWVGSAHQLSFVNIHVIIRLKTLAAFRQLPPFTMAPTTVASRHISSDTLLHIDSIGSPNNIMVYVTFFRI